MPALLAPFLWYGTAAAAVGALFVGAKRGVEDMTRWFGVAGGLYLLYRLARGRL